MAIDPARAKSLFLAASEIADPAERAAYLNRECGEDAELRARVEALLRVNDASPPQESQPVQATGDCTPDESAADASADPADKDEKAGTVIADKYKLVDLIGEGGMGSVWRAKQTEPVKRFVAVKLIKAGMDSRQVLARFEAERQALALMDHPNIAKVLDGGLHQHRPFFVMEVVKGVPITDFCDARKLTPKERLELLSDLRHLAPKDSPQLAGTLAAIGWNLLHQGQWAQAEPLLRKCLTIRQKTQPDDWRTFSTLSMLGGALLGQKRYTEAEPLLLKGYEGMKQREKTIPKGGEPASPRLSTG